MDSIPDSLRRKEGIDAFKALSRYNFALFPVSSPWREEISFVTNRHHSIRNSPLSQSYVNDRILDVLQRDINDIFITLSDKRVFLPPATMTRLYRANLPRDDSQRVGELLGKVAAIDRSRRDIQTLLAKLKRDHEDEVAHMREDAARERAILLQEATAAREEKRMAEFEAARAHAMSEARGATLLKKNAALEEARAQQVKLSEMLQVALGKLGYEFVPEPESPPVAPTSPDTGKTDPLEERSRKDQLWPEKGSENDILDGEFDGENTRDSSSGFGNLKPDSGWHKHSAQEQGLNRRLESTPNPRKGNIKDNDFVIYSNELSTTPSPVAPLSLDGESALSSGISDSGTKWKDISEAVVASSVEKEFKTPSMNTMLHTNIQASAESWAEQETQRLLSQLNASQLESLVEFGNMAASGLITSPEMRQKVLEVVHHGKSGNHEHLNAAKQISSKSSDMGRKGNSVLDEKINRIDKFGVREQERHSQRYDGDSTRVTSSTGGLSPTHRHRQSSKDEDALADVGPLGMGAKNKTLDVISQSSTRSVEEPSAKPTSKQNCLQKSANKKDGLIKAVSLSKTTIRQKGMSENNPKRSMGPQDDEFARQRRAAQRLMEKLNAKLPPEYRSQDPAAFGLNISNDSPAYTSSLKFHDESNGDGRVLPGSLRAEHV